RRLIALRRDSEAIHRGSYEAIEVPVPDCVAYERVAAGERKIVALNLSSKAVEIDLGVSGTVVVSTHLAAEGRDVEGVLELDGSEGVVIDVGDGVLG
ncbi:MAG: DUF3459 domain-containing protein, partial [Solirubrobacterales bacterium]